MGGFFQTVSDWATKPFNSSQGMVGWFLTIGFLIMALALWHQAFNEIARVAGAAAREV